MPRRDQSRAARNAPLDDANGRASSTPETLTGKSEAGPCLAPFQAHEGVAAPLAMARGHPANSTPLARGGGGGGPRARHWLRGRVPDRRAAPALHRGEGE